MKRVGFTETMPNTNVSIFINNTRESDSGRYVLNVIIPGQRTLTEELTLTVKGRNQSKGWDQGIAGVLS